MKKMSKSDLDQGLLQNKLITADGELIGQRAGNDSLSPIVDRETITPLAKKVVENVVLEALSILDTSYEQGKPWRDILAAKRSSSNQSCESCLPKTSKTSDIRVKPPFKEEPALLFTPAVVQRSVVQVMTLQVHDDASCDAIHAEEVAKIVKGLQDIQIGDSAYVLPADGSNLEKQVKRAVYNINSLNFHDMETAELIICDGQGDVDTEILEAEIGPPNNMKPQHDAAKVSTYFLHKMIEELEETDSGKEHLVDCSNKEKWEEWEENEEKFIQVIEGPSDEKIKDRETVDPENDELSIADRKQVSECLESILPTIVNNEYSSRVDDSTDKNEELEEDLDAVRESNHPRDLLDNFASKEPYWSSAGLIMRSVPQSHKQLSTKTPLIEVVASIPEEKHVSGDVRIETVPAECSKVDVDVKSEVLSVNKKPLPEKQPEKLKSTKKKTFGGKIRKFFSSFGRSKDC